jgi:hypothetical protein
MVKQCVWCSKEFEGDRFDFFCSDCQTLLDRAAEANKGGE